MDIMDICIYVYLGYHVSMDIWIYGYLGYISYLSKGYVLEYSRGYPRIARIYKNP